MTDVDSPRWEAAPHTANPPARDAMAELRFHCRGVLSESVEIPAVAVGEAPPWEET